MARRTRLDLLIDKMNQRSSFFQILKTFQRVLTSDNLPLIILRQGLNARAVLDDPSLLKRIEENAQFQMSSIAAIDGSLLSGIGCLLGTEFIVRDHIKAGTLVARPIVEPTLNRTLYVGELSYRPPTFAQEAIRQLCIDLTVEAVTSKRWEATLAT